MAHVQAFKTTNAFLSLGFLLFFVLSINATEKDTNERSSQERKQEKITQFLSKPIVRPKLDLQVDDRKAHALVPPRGISSSSSKVVTIDLTRAARTTEEKPSIIKKRSLQHARETSKSDAYAHRNNPQEQQDQKRSSAHVEPVQSVSKRSRKVEVEMQVSFLHGANAHIQAYSRLIDEAESHIIIASWNVNFISQDIFSSLLDAKKRGVHVGFIVNSVKRKQTLQYFYDDGEDEKDKDATFTLFETKSHAKFLFVDGKSLIVGSFNALGDSFEESDDASFRLRGTIQQLWPFYMSIYETYTSIEEYPGGIFDGIALISKARNPGQRSLLQRSFDDGSQIFLLRTIKEHEDFFKLAIPHNGKVTIYSPFSTKDNTLKRLKKLESLLAVGTEIHLKVLQQYENGLNRLLAQAPNLKRHAQVQVATSHQKIIVLGDHTICVGSLNWLSAAQDAKDPYSNVELSVVLQGPKAQGIIESYYNH